MTIDAPRIALVRESFALLGPELEETSREFYDTLFEIAPHLRPMFRDDMTGQGMRFMTTLRVMVERLTDPLAFKAEVAELGRGHAAWGVEKEHFALMREALMRTLKARLGERLTPEAESAWRDAFDMVAEEMMAPRG
jgi:nitric oxide dioxygenase